MTAETGSTPELAWLRHLAVPTDPYLSCDDCFDQIDRYVDSLTRGPAELDELLRVHLAACAVCFEEAESLVALTGGEASAGLLRTAVHGGAGSS